MKTCLVGYTGFVGTNLEMSYPYEGLYNSKNIMEAWGTCPDLLVYAGVTGTKYLANHEPEKDLEAKRIALENIRKIHPKRLVLISTVDVYRDPVAVNEDSTSDTEGMQAYGYTRLLLESWVRKEYPEALFIRLPGIYGKGLKKNFIFDMIHLVPPMLTDRKREELLSINPFIRPYYANQGDGFWKLECEGKADYALLREYFEHIGFNAMNFTDSRGIYQYYPLNCLQRHMEMALQAGIRVLNIATEPFAIDEMVSYVDQKAFTNCLGHPPIHYDVRTKYNDVMGGAGGYIMTKAEVLDNLKTYVHTERELLTRFQTEVLHPFIAERMNVLYNAGNSRRRVGTIREA